MTWHNASVAATLPRLGNNRCELTNEVDQHIPLAAVVGGIGEQELDQSAVYRLLPLGCLHTGLQEVVAPLHLKGGEKREMIGRGGGHGDVQSVQYCPVYRAPHTKGV